MIKLRIYSVFIILIIFSFISPKPIQAHPGRTASDGCHYCRTNCSDWGEVENARHCHNDGSSAPEVKTYVAPVPVVEKKVVAPTARPVATIRPTAKPIPTAKPMPTAVPIPTTAVIVCSQNSDSYCPSNCSAGNDADCCTERLSTHQWYDNQGCYPKKEFQCSAISDGICPVSCETGHDYDCCYERLEGYEWIEGRGCYN